MSSSCHLFLAHNLSASFRARVINIVSMTFIFNRETLPFRSDFWIAGTRCLLNTNSHDILRSASRWKRPQLSGAQSFEMEIIVDPKLDNTTTPPAFFRGNGQIVFGFLPPNSFVTYDLLRKRVQAVLSQQAAHDDDFVHGIGPAERLHDDVLDREDGDAGSDAQHNVPSPPPPGAAVSRRAQAGPAWVGGREARRRPLGGHPGQVPVRVQGSC